MSQSEESALPIPPAAVPLTLALFGPLDVRRGEAPLPRLRSRKGYALLALLALRQGMEVERSWLAALLWPDSDHEQALANLRTTLKDLRRALGAESGRLGAASPRSLALRLDGAVVDVIAFDAAIARGDALSLAEAVRHYRGPLLEGWTDEWAFQERERREQAYLSALETLAAQARAGGETSAAEHYLRRAVAVDPTREATWRLLLEVLAEAGDYTAALESFHRLREHLHRELNAEPAPETVRLLQRIRVEARERATRRLRDDSRERSRPVGAGGTPSSPPQARTAEQPALPVPPTRLLGRERELHELCALAARDEPRLVTLSGPAGVGKTRLGLEVAWVLSDAYADGVFWISMAGIHDAALVVAAIAQGLGVRETEEVPLADGLRHFLRRRHVLLVLDNFEHVLAAAPVIAELLAAAPRLHVRVTSRSPLRLRGERVFAVEPLAVPEPRTWSMVEGPWIMVDGVLRPHQPSTINHPVSAIMQYAAVALFVQRAQDAAPGFQLTDANATDVAAICHRLDGLPLAIELAAARIRLFPPATLLAQLERRLDTLTHGARDLPERQRTLRDAIRWSYQLLTSPEQILFRHLAVFVGGCSLEAAAAMHAAADLEPREVIESLSSLVDQSLIQRTRGAHDEPRFSMLATIQEFARECLIENDEEEVATGKMAAYFLALGQRLVPETAGVLPDGWLDRLAWDNDNLRAVVSLAIHRQDAELGCGIFARFWQFWLVRGAWTEVRQSLAAILALEGASPLAETRPVALELAANLARYQGDLDAARLFAEQALAAGRSAGDQNMVMRTLCYLGRIALERNDFATAKTFLGESLTLARTVAPGWSVWTLLTLGQLEARVGNAPGARARYEEILAVSHGTHRVRFDALNGLAQLALREGDGVSARALILERIDVILAQGNRWCTVQALNTLAQAAALQGEPLRAARAFGAAEAQLEMLGAPMSAVERDRRGYDRAVAGVRDVLGDTAFAAVWEEGRAMTAEEAIADAREETPSHFTEP